MLSASCVPLHAEGLAYHDESCIEFGTYITDCYGVIQFIDDIDHGRTYWQYGTFIADLMEAVRTFHFKEIFEWECVAEFRNRYGNRSDY